MGEILWTCIEYISKDPFVQLTGFWAMIIVFIAYLQKDDFTVKKLMLLSTVLWMTHFYLLEVYIALVANAIWIVRFFLSVKFGRSRNAFLFVIGLTLFSSYFTVSDWWSLLPIFGSIIGAFWYFFLEKIRLRFAMLVGNILWITFHTHIGSLTGVMNDVMTQWLLLFTIYRMAHPEWGTAYYAQKVKEILWKTRRPDYDRFVFVYDKVTQYRNSLWFYFREILHYDLKKFFLADRWKRLFERFIKLFVQ